MPLNATLGYRRKHQRKVRLKRPEEPVGFWTPLGVIER